MAWESIQTAPKEEEDETGLPPALLIGCFRDGVLIWAMLARWSCVSYGYIQCASRSGWEAIYMPRMAKDAERPRPCGCWIMPDEEFRATHWMKIEDELK